MPNIISRHHQFDNSLVLGKFLLIFEKKFFLSEERFSEITKTHNFNGVVLNLI